MAAEYIKPEEINPAALASLGKLVELKTFKTNAPSSNEELEESTELTPLKIICVGDYTGGVRSKGMFIEDYLRINPAFKTHPFTCVNLYLKRAKWRLTSTSKTRYSIFLQFCEISEMDRFSAMTQIYFRYSQGALVFWGPQNPSSLSGAVKWRRKIKEEVCSSIPCVLITDSVPDPCEKPQPWIGPGKIFESEATLDQFCRDHGFVDCFEIASRDWKSGERSIFGRAVNCLLDNIFRNEQKEAKDWM